MDHTVLPAKYTMPGHAVLKTDFLFHLPLYFSETVVDNSLGFIPSEKNCISLATHCNDGKTRVSKMTIVKMYIHGEGQREEVVFRRALKTGREVIRVNASHTRHRALGPELIPVYRQSACR